MQYLQIDKNTKLKDLSSIVGDRNVDYILVANNLDRSVNIGQSLQQACSEAISENPNVDPQRKKTILNKMTDDSDIFEYASLLSEVDWRVLSNINTFPNYLYIPETISIPSYANTLGNNESIGKDIYLKVMDMLSTDPYMIDPVVFNEYSNIKSSQIISSRSGQQTQGYWFKVPLGEVTLYSSLSNSSVDFPCYPEEVDNSIKANYTTMPDLIYQYEPWYLYESSGPRSNTYTFDIHRDMWTGDYRDGKANELIRFCEACCYPKYNGSAVYSDIVTLYVSGSALIRGIVTSVDTKWDGPLLQDGWYAHFQLEISITEISDTALNYDTVRSKPLIG